MTSMLILEPRFVVVIPLLPGVLDLSLLGPSRPWNDQEMVRGWSPEVTMQDIWAKSPSFITSLEKENAPISGSSEETKFLSSFICSLYPSCQCNTADSLNLKTNFLLTTLLYHHPEQTILLTFNVS